MDLNRMIGTLKEHPEYHKMGMIAGHVGVVRETSLSGEHVKGIEVAFNQDAINLIISEIEFMLGIIKVLVDVFPGTLKVGDDIMAVVVGGDTREHVFPALMTAVDRIKTEGSRKKEFF